jgi:UPF0716 protein FxsA
MFSRLLVLFTIVPIIELTVLIPLSQQIGLWPTIGLIAFTAIAGAWLGKSQGSAAWKRIQAELATGQLPGDSILDGLAVLVASAFLVTPGVLTDLAGFILLIPFTRAPIRRFVRRRFDKWMTQGGGGVYTSFGGGHGAAYGYGWDEEHDAREGDGPQVIDAPAQPRREREPRHAAAPVVLDLNDEGEVEDAHVGAHARSDV